MHSLNLRRPLSLVMAVVTVVGALAAAGPARANDPSALPPVPEELNRPSVHVEQAAENAAEPTTWEPGAVPEPIAGTGTVATSEVAPLAIGPGGALPNGLKREVLGFLPYWMLSDPAVVSSLRYDRLSTIAYFDIVLRGEGSVIREGPGWNGWNSAALTNVMNAAHARGVKVVLTVSMHGWDAAGNGLAQMTQMLNSASARARAVSEVVTLVKARNADGVNLDFEPVPTELRANFTAFVREMKAGLVHNGAGSYLTVDTMAGAASWSTGYDVRALTAAGAADAIMVMAYDLSWNGSARAGGVAPIRSPYIFDVTDSLTAHLAAGVAPSKIIWGVPYYGRTWATTSDALNATTRPGASYAWNYTDALAHAARYGRRWDPTGQVPWYAWYNAGWWQGYYDDAESLAAKYDLVNAHNLAGVGIWALGMDAGRSELWNVIAARFIRVVGRIAGPDRYATSAAVSRAHYGPGVPVVYVATGLDFPDALTAGPAAARAGGPLLLVRPSRVPEATLAELDRLDPARIVVLGGVGAVSDGVAAALAPYATTGVVTRLAGADRYETAAAVSAASFSPGVPVAYLATGEAYPDALTGSAAAGITGGPVLLATRDTLPAATAAELDRLNPARIVVLGGTGAIGDAVAGAMWSFAPSVARISGLDRYATAVALSQATFPGEASKVYVATGSAFPDGLAAAAVTGRLGIPLLLVPSNRIPPSVVAEIRRLNPLSITVIGGSGAVSDGVLAALAGI